MRTTLLLFFGILTLNTTLTAFAADSQQSELEVLRAELDTLRQEYQASIDALERRVVAAEAQAQLSVDVLRQSEQKESSLPVPTTIPKK